MSNFYCLECDKIQRHLTIEKIIKSGLWILRCNVCGTDQKFTQEDYVRMPKGV